MDERWFFSTLSKRDYFLFFLVLLVQISSTEASTSGIVRINDHAELKKVIRVHTNVLIFFHTGESTSTIRSLQSVLTETANLAFGKATIASVDCQSTEGKKLCKKLKISPTPFLLRHFHQGEFNKDYDRQLKPRSIYRFLLDPTGDLPWDEDPSGSAVTHLADKRALQKLLRSSQLPVLVMMYTPWCGYCKRLKPDFASAAAAVKDKAVLAAIDLDEPENADVQRLYEVEGFPTLVYFEDGKYKFKYGGENSKEGIVEWLKNPTPKAEKAAGDDDEASEGLAWADDPDTSIVHLTDETFQPFLAQHPSVLVMFHAPWCGHCKHAKPEFEAASRRLKADGVVGALAAIDATLHKKIAAQFTVQGFPTFKYFKDGQFMWDLNERTEQKFYQFMLNPVAPPEPEKPWNERGGFVSHLRGEDFASLRRKKHALVMFYAPWCGHCKRAMPEFDAAAERLAERAGVSMAAVDCTKEEALCSQHSVAGFPTIFYFKYLKEQKSYNGKHDADSFVRFLEEQMKDEKDRETARDSEKNRRSGEL